MKPKIADIKDVRDRCLREIQSLKLPEESYRNVVLVCTMDALNWVLGEEDEGNLGIKPWKDL
jgi:hypothetical protein